MLEMFKGHFNRQWWRTKPLRIVTGIVVLVFAQLQGNAAAQRRALVPDVSLCLPASHAGFENVRFADPGVLTRITPPVIVGLGTRLLLASEIDSRVSEKESPAPARLWPGDVTNAAWVVFGLFGQMLFGARMLVQWIASEKRKQVVVPVAFWWFSVSGGVMLVIYFIRRRDIVGVLGQFLPLIIYLRNLYFIYGNKKPSGPQTPG
jgi:lipid-A-disaccharide synthase-like uncharacterized protein